MTTTHENFLGIPVEGTIYSVTRDDQFGIGEFEKLLMPVLMPMLDVEALRWTQYTPYFNDGDTCEFSIHQVEVRLAGTSADIGESGDGFISLYDLTYTDSPPLVDLPAVKKALGVSVKTVHVAGHNGHVYDRQELDESTATDLFRAWTELNALMEGSSHFYDLMLEKFGDHAKVTVTRQKISVETVEHD